LVYQAVGEDKEPTDLAIAQALTDVVPLSKTMDAQIVGLRSWATGRTRFVTSPVAENKLRKLVCDRRKGIHRKAGFFLQSVAVVALIGQPSRQCAA